MSKQNAAKNKTVATPGPDVFHAAPDVQEPRILSRVQMPGAITAADLDEVLTILPESKLKIIIELRYDAGEGIQKLWDKIEKAREKLEELKARFAG